MKKQKKIKTPTSQFDYHLPQNLIAQEPTKPRDHARLLILDKKAKKTEHKRFYQLDQYLDPGDVIVLNNSKVIPARLLGKKETGGKIEIFLLNKIINKKWEVLIGGKTKVGDKIYFTKKIIGEITSKDENNRTSTVQFNCNDKKIFSIGETPIPPYIKQKSNLRDYQTIYAKTEGSVAAPTAGLHFTKELIKKLEKKGIKFEYITLHVGLGTFSPVKSKYIEDHEIHSEYAILNKDTAQKLNTAKQKGHKIIAVGTTTVRTLEAFTTDKKSLLLEPQSKWVNIFIYPGYRFRFVDEIITNFHLPESSLIMLISAFSKTALIKKVYKEAIRKKYKFYSFGDAMLIK